MSHTPTGEQAEVLDWFGLGADLVVQARAGTGKTSTLKMLANSTSERGVYVAYNKAIATDAARDFPARVLCKTAHGLAYGAVGKHYNHRLSGPRMPARVVAELLRINEPVRYADDRAPLAPQQLGRLVMETIQRFCYSADDRIGPQHTATVTGVDLPAQRQILAGVLVPLAQRAWDEDLTRVDGQLGFTHDTYLKMWCLTRPQLGVDYVLLDEAQDSNPCVAALVEGQQSQRILVGDACQAIYGWRGATDAMSNFDGHVLNLSQSFRFGPAVAAEANKWLSLLGARPHVTGRPDMRSTVGPTDRVDAVLCRSNAGAMLAAMDGLDAGRRTALVGGAGDMKRMAEAALTLKQGMGCHHPELFVFRDWVEVQEYVQTDAAGSDLRVFVSLIDTHGASEVMRVCDRLVDEDTADLVVSTAHRSKGREWSSVRIADDFREPRDQDGEPGEVSREDAMLAYVAVTRARHHLDRTGLAWVDRYIAARRQCLADALEEAVEEVLVYVLDHEGEGDPVVDEIASAVRRVAAEAPPAVPLSDEQLAVHAESPIPVVADLAQVIIAARRCPRCSANREACICDPAALNRWLQLTGATA